MTMRDAGRPASPAPLAPRDVRSTAVPQPGLLAPRRASYGLIVLGSIGIIVVAVALLLVLVYLISGLGTGAFVIAGTLALVPLVIVLLGIRWIDRWDPEPRAALIFAFLWGAGVAVIVALVVGAEIDNVVNSLGGPGPGYEFFGAVIQAPIVEESGKALGVLLLFLVARRHFDGPVDGIVYAAMVAAGFAFSENILYFGQAVIEQGASIAGLVQIFQVRGLLSPFAHVMFTACTGFFLGLAASRSRGIGWIGYLIVGLLPAIALHALWNGSLFIVRDFYGYYALVQVPLFVLAIVLVVYLRRQEAAVTRRNLGDYAAAGWFSPDEVGALATGSGRRVAMAWARQNGVGRAMQRYIRTAARLAFTRQRVLAGINLERSAAEEEALLASLAPARAALRGNSAL